MKTRKEIAATVRHCLYIEVPNYAYWRRHWRLHEETGIMLEPFYTFKRAYVEYLEDGSCECFAVYAFGDVILRSHYELRDGVIDVTDIFRAWMTSDQLHAGKHLQEIIDAVTDAILDDLAKSSAP